MLFISLHFKLSSPQLNQLFESCDYIYILSSFEMKWMGRLFKRGGWYGPF